MMHGTRAPWLVAMAGIALLAGACTGGGDGGDDDPDPDAGVDGEMPDGATGDAGPMVDMALDQAVEPDAGPPTCFTEGGGLEAASISDPLFGLEAFRADVDPDDDGRPDLLFRRAGNDGLYFDLADGRTLESLGSYAALGAIDARLMPGVWPPEALTAPLPGRDGPEWLALEIRAVDARLSRVDAATLEAIESYDLAVPVTAVRTIRSARPVALVDLSDGGCTAISLVPDGPSAQWGLCRLVPLPDVNGDDIPEVLRLGRAGIEMFDGLTFESLAFEPDIDIEALGLAADGPVDVRGEGPEIVSVSIEDGGALVARYHDPVDLSITGGPETLRPTGIYTRLRFVESGGVLRIVAELDRNGQLFLQLIEPGRMLRRLGEYGPFQVLRWGTPGDVDGDGQLDIELRGGAIQDGTNTDVRYLRLRDGATVYEIPSERAARFDSVWSTTLPPTPTDLDGCPGIDRVLLRSGPPRANGVRASRVHFLDDAGLLRTRSEPYDGRVHALLIADLDGVPPAELLEIRSENDDSARLRVYTPR